MPESFKSQNVSAVRVSDLGLKFSMGLRWLPGGDTESIRNFVNFASCRDWRTPETNSYIEQLAS